MSNVWLELLLAVVSAAVGWAARHWGVWMPPPTNPPPPSSTSSGSNGG